MNAEDKALLQFERDHPRPGGMKDYLIREGFDFAPTSYFQRLNTLLDDPEAYLFDPQLVKRLRRMRDRHRQARASA